MLFFRNIVIAILAWGFIEDVASTSEPEPPMMYHQQQGDGDGDGWHASFYYVPPSSSTSSSDENNVHGADNQPSFHELNPALRHYREMADGIIRQLQISHEVASRTEALLLPKDDASAQTKSTALLSSKLEQKISKTASLLEQNAFVLQELLKPFPIKIGLSQLHHGPDLDSLSASRSTQASSPPSNDNLHPLSPQCIARYIPPYNPNKHKENEGDMEAEPYDTANHIITHIARDWTSAGESIRKQTHDWIVDQLWKYHNMHHAGEQPTTNKSGSTSCPQQSPLSPVLVPGAGMARLAFDIAFDSEQCYPFAVEAIDNSIVMATAAHHLLRYCSRNDDSNVMTIYPIASDPFINEVDTQRRWESAEFPERNVVEQLQHLNTNQQSSHQQPSLAYVVGDFVSTYASPSRRGMYGSITTCFFIDTATNIYEYIITIRNLLRAGGVWINLGPVQWHRNAQLAPSTDELKDMIILSGFEVRHWEISEELLAYRHPDDIRTGTRAEAYRPLKFVVVKKPSNEDGDSKIDGQDLLSTLGMLRQTTGRKIQHEIIEEDQLIEPVDVLGD